MHHTVLHVLEQAIQMIDGADTDCVTTLRRGVRTVVAATDPVAEHLCRLQYEGEQGPIHNELWHADMVVSHELGGEARWPQFAAAAVDTGVRSLAAFRLYTGQGDLGALSLYSRSVVAFDADAVLIGHAVAAHAAIAVLSAAEREQYQTAIASRDIIGQAKGMLMERYDLDSIAAFEMLTRWSQSENVPLRRLAEALVETEHPITSVTEQQTS